MVYATILGALRMLFVFWDHDEKTLVLTYCDDLLNASLEQSD